MAIILRIIRFIRYRFFIFAGMFPYLLGQTIAFNTQKSFNWHNFYWGFLGIFLVLGGVELLNEYFDAQAGGDRIFSLEKPLIPGHFYLLGLLAFTLAFFIGLYLACITGWRILLFSFLGFLGAYFYVGPPFKWAYRGLGEIVIALSYGPLMVLGSYYLQAKKIEIIPFYASLLCGLSLFCLAILNEIPDYYQDRLVGKRNLVVRMGKQKAIKFLKLCFGVVFLLLAFGFILRKIPSLAMINFLILPWLLKSLSIAEKNYDNPGMFRSVINTNVVIYFVLVLSLSIGYL
jgi:1,4-dihydroxy-2-naphthoate octaprenyltransferase